MLKKKMRLDKYLGHTGQGSRSVVQKLIKQKRVKVDEVVINKPDYQIIPEEAVVTLDGKAMIYKPFYHFILNKPSGYITATKDNKEKTIMDLLCEEDKNKMVVPVGRLDKDTEGLLVLTSDGKMAHELLSPKKHVPKKYYAELEGEITLEDQEKIKKGLVLKDGTLCLPAILEIIESNKASSKVYLTLEEGKFHQVKRMMANVGAPVVSLKRVQMGLLEMPQDLMLGEYRELTEEELRLLRGEK